MRKFFIIHAIAAAFVSVLPFLVSCEREVWDPMELHRAAVVFDAHCDTAMRLVGDGGVDLGARLERGHIDLPRMMEGGLDAQIFAVWVNPGLPEEEWVEKALAMIDAVREQAEKHPDSLEIALRGKDVGRIIDRGKVAAVIGIEGGHAIRDDLELLREYYGRGVRCMTLTWMNTNLWADASNDTARWSGLNTLGREAVREMDRLGMLIDCAHVSDSTFFDVLDVTRNPVLISHSCMRALCDIPRNVSDDVLRALAENGGVICVNYFPGFLDQDYNEKSEKIWSDWRARHEELVAKYDGDRRRAWDELRPSFRREVEKLPPIPLALLVDHIDHAVSVAGIDHVGLGSDFDGISVTPEGLDDVAKLPLITQELAERGYSRSDIEKILGGNLLRLVERVVQ